jgi:hypothetical protein
MLRLDKIGFFGGEDAMDLVAPEDGLEEEVGVDILTETWKEGSPRQRDFLSPSPNSKSTHSGRLETTQKY